MAAGERTLKVKIDGENRGLDRAASSAASSVTKFDKSVSTVGRTAARSGKDIDGFGKKVKGSGDDIDKAGKHADGTRQRLGGIGSAAGLAAVGVGALAAAWISTTASALMEIERLNAQTDTVIKSMNAAWTNTDHITDYAGHIEQLSGIEAENVQSGQNLLLTYGNIQNQMGKGNDIFDQATSLMVDLSVATGKAMPEAANLLGKALNDPIAGLSALSRVGIQFTEQQKTQIRAMVEAGNTMGAQKIILAELQRQFGGSAAAFGETAAGQVAKFQNRLGDLSESLLSSLIPVLTQLLDIAEGVINWLIENQGLVKTLAIALAGLATTYGLVNASIKLVNASTIVWNAITSLARGKTVGLGAGFASLSKTAKVASLSMGAIGLVLTGVGVLMSAFAGQSEAAATRQQSLRDFAKSVTAELEKQNGVINQNVREVAASEAENNGWAKTAKEVGVSSQDLIDALLGDEGARGRAIAQIDKYIAGLDSSGGATWAQTGFANGLRAALEGSSGAIEEQTALDGYLAEGKKEVAKFTGFAVTAEGDYRGAITLLSGEYQRQITLAEELDQKRRALAGIALDGREAERQYQDAIDQASDALEKNHRTIDNNTEAGRNNNAALDNIAKTTLDTVIPAMQAQGATTEQIRGKVLNARNSFISMAIQMGYTAPQARNLANQLGLIPGNYNAKITANTSPAALKIRELERQIEAVTRARSIPFFATQPAGPIGGGRATGGPVLPGRSYVVGERGPEIFRAPNTGGTIEPNHQLGGGDLAVYVTIDGQQLQGRITKTVQENNRSIRRSATAGAGGAR